MALDALGQVFSQRDDSGSAFILGKNEALDDLKEGMKYALEVLGKQKIKAQKDIADMTMPESKGMIPADIERYYAPAKIDLLNMQRNMSERAANDPKYVNSPDYWKDKSEFNKKSTHLENIVDASTTQQKQVYEWGTRIATDPNVDHDESLQAMGEWIGKKDPITRAQDVEAPIVRKFNKDQFQEDFKKTWGEFTGSGQSGNIETTTKNPIYEMGAKGIKYGKDGKPIKTDFYKNTFEPKVNDFITSHPEAIRNEIKTKEFKDDDNSTAKQKAIESLKEGLADILPKEFKSGEKFKPDEGDKEMSSQGVQRDVVINTPTASTPDATWKSDLFFGHTSKQEIEIPNVSGTLNMNTRAPLKNASSTIKIAPAGTAYGSIKKADGTIEKNAYEIGTITDYKPADYDKTKDKLTKDALKTIGLDKVYTKSEYADLSTDDKKQYDEALPSEDDIKDEMVRQGKAEKISVAIPYDAIKHNLSQHKINTKMIDETLAKEKGTTIGEGAKGGSTKTKKSYTYNGTEFSYDDIVTKYGKKKADELIAKGTFK